MINVTLTMTNEQFETLAEKVAALMGKALPVADAPDLMTAAEAAQYLRCARRRIYDLMSAGRLPRLREGGRVLVRRADLDRLVEEG
jgi:excisionase family DNA binding protein